MANFIADNGFDIGHPDHEFVGWDELGGEAVEATHAKHLGVKMGNAMKEMFSNMSPGETYIAGSGRRLFRM